MKSGFCFAPSCFKVEVRRPQETQMKISGIKLAEQNVTQVAGCLSLIENESRK
jgi:hypothetical protein